MRHMWSIVAFAAIAAGCAKVVVVPVRPGLRDEGVFYALPKTVARVLVKVDREVKQPAPYAMFAPIFAPDAAPACGTIRRCRPDAKTGEVASVTKFALQQGSTFTTFGEPDPDQVFLVRFKGGGTIDQDLSMTWNDVGLLGAASASVTNRSADVGLAGLKLLTGLGTKAAAGATRAETIKDRGRCPDAHANDEWAIKALKAVEPDPATSTLVSNYCDLPATDRDPDPGKDENSRDDFDRNTDRVWLERAAAAYYRRVQPLVARRINILTGDANILDPVALLDRLDALIDEQLRMLFVGSENKKTWDGPFEVRSLAPGGPVTILGISETSGICPVAALLAPDAKPLPDTFRASPAECGRATPVTVSVDYHPSAPAQLFHKVRESVAAPDGDRSFRYVLPAQVKGVVRVGEVEHGAGVFNVAQLGHVVSLPARRRSKSLAYDLTMVEATGALKAFKLGTTGGLDAATVDALAGAGGTILDARSARREKAEEAADELTILTRESTLLKLKDEICEIQKKYGLACTIQP